LNSAQARVKIKAGWLHAWNVPARGYSGEACMRETQEHWYRRQAIERLAQHIPFEQNLASKAEQIEMLRGLVLHHGREMDPEVFGFEARSELERLGLWGRIGPGQV
jgi:hypothetical protein